MGKIFAPTGSAGSGDVNGPASATDGAIARYDGGTGKLLKDGSPIANSELATMAAITVKGNNTTSAAVPTDLTSGQLALLLPAPLKKVWTSSGTWSRCYAFYVTDASFGVTAGDTYSNNSQTFTIEATTTQSQGVWIYARSSGSPLSSGVLTRTSGSGSATVNFGASFAPKYLQSIVTAGGGGGGGAATTTAGQTSCGSGGGGGGTAIKVISGASLGATETVTVGAGGGGGGAGSAGSTGGSSSFGSHSSATGGAGGNVSAASSAARISGGQVGGAGSNGDTNLTGGSGGSAIGTAGGVIMGGGGGGSFWGGGAGGGIASSGTGTPGAAASYGSGGGGAANGTTGNSGLSGATGAAGVVITEEFYQ